VLTADLVRVRRRGEKIWPVWLRGPQAERTLPVAQTLIDLFEQAPGCSVGQLDDQLKQLPDTGLDRARFAGLIKLLKDGCELQPAPAADAESVRAALFLRAADARRRLGLLDTFDRQAAILACGAALGASPESVDQGLFADLPSAQVILSVRRTSAHALLQRYNLALAQGVLLRATRVEIDLDPASAPRLREIFRRIKFCRLMHQVQGDATSGYRLTLDGPLSLFEATQRYGVQLALFLPTLVAGEGWRLRADVLWGKQRARALFELSDADGLVSTARDSAAELQEVDTLERAFARIGGPWSAARQPDVFDIRGRGVFVPDLVFIHNDTGVRVYLEVFGYWSRDAVFKRVELLDASFPHKVILAVSKRLRVSDEVAGDDFPGRILVYSSAIAAGSVVRMLEQVGGQR
jgi:uncharacterized protein